MEPFRKKTEAQSPLCSTSSFTPQGSGGTRKVPQGAANIPLGAVWLTAKVTLSRAARFQTPTRLRGRPVSLASGRGGSGHLTSPGNVSDRKCPFKTRHVTASCCQLSREGATMPRVSFNARTENSEGDTAVAETPGGEKKAPPTELPVQTNGETALQRCRC